MTLLFTIVLVAALISLLACMLIMRVVGPEIMGLIIKK